MSTPAVERCDGKGWQFAEQGELEQRCPGCPACTPAGERPMIQDACRECQDDAWLSCVTAGRCKKYVDPTLAHDKPASPEQAARTADEWWRKQTPPEAREDEQVWTLARPSNAPLASPTVLDLTPERVLSTYPHLEIIAVVVPESRATEAERALREIADAHAKNGHELQQIARRALPSPEAEREAPASGAQARNEYLRRRVDELTDALGRYREAAIAGDKRIGDLEGELGAAFTLASPEGRHASIFSAISELRARADAAGTTHELSGTASLRTERDGDEQSRAAYDAVHGEGRWDKLSPAVQDHWRI